MRTTQIFFFKKNNNPNRVFANAPYADKESFLKATQSAFKNRYGMSPEKESKIAWEHYEETLKSSSQMPAIFYESKDYNSIKKYEHNSFFGFDENLVTTGRQYYPREHTWTINAAWLLSQVHKTRGILAISNVSHHLKTYTKELSCAFKAGYKISHFWHNNTISAVYLVPPPREKALKVTIFNFLKVSEQQRKKTQEKFTEKKKKLTNKHSQKDIEDKVPANSTFSISSHPHKWCCLYKDRCKSKENENTINQICSILKKL